MAIKINNTNSSIKDFKTYNINNKNKDNKISQEENKNIENQKKNVNEQQQTKKSPETKFPLGNQVDIKA